MNKISTAPDQRLPAPFRLLRSAHGAEFNINDDVWRLRNHGNREIINFGSIRSIVTPELQDAARTAFATIASTRTASSASQIFYDFAGLVRISFDDLNAPVPSIEPEMLARWVTQPDRRLISNISNIRTLFETWRVLRAPCVPSETFALLTRIVRPRDPQTYEYVVTWDPANGPYLPVEDDAIRLALDTAFTDGHISLRQYTLMRIFRGLGPRPIQIAALKVKDFKREGEQSFLRIPLAKKRNTSWRDRFLPWKPITINLARVLEQHIESNLRSTVSSDGALDDEPLFPRERDGEHLGATNIQAEYNRTFLRLEVLSPQTGEPINGTPTRERHTFLTYLASRGCSAEEIAANAGHDKISSCEAYVEASIDHFQRMEEHVGAAFVADADRFHGAVVDEQDDASIANALFNDDAQAVGSCAAGGCNAVEANAAPMACYTCRKFRAWSDAPHADLLEMLETRQGQLRKEGHDAVAETLTSTIVAIGNLLARIAKQ